MTSVSGPGLAAWVASGALVRTDVARAVATSSRHGARRGWTGERDMAMTPRMLTVGQAGSRKVYRSDVAGVKEALFSPSPTKNVAPDRSHPWRVRRRPRRLRTIPAGLSVSSHYHIALV